MLRNSDCCKSKEIHLFVLWENVSIQKQRIISDIKENFNVKKIVSILWSKEKFAENLSRFYGENLPKKSGKEKHCGTGRFTAIIVEDVNPIYDVRKTSKGFKYVNINIFDKKQEYRVWTGGGQKVHGTDNEYESAFHIAMILGEDYKIYHSFMNDCAEVFYDKDLVGAEGWGSFSDVFNILNITTKYVVLRNFDNIEKQLESEHPDVDLLVSDKRKAVQVLNAKPTNNKKYRVQYEVLIDGKKINFDLREIGDGYYDEFWQNDILKNRVFFKDGFYIPSEVDHLYSLLYHAFYHKESVSRDYLLKFSEKKDFLSHGSCLTHDDLLSDLNMFMREKKYRVTEPYDLSVFFNSSLGCFQLSRKRLVKIKFQKFKIFIKSVIARVYHA